MANNVAHAMGGSATARDNARIYYMAFGNGGSSVDILVVFYIKHPCK